MASLRRKLGDLHWSTRRAIAASSPVRAWTAVFNPLWLARLRLNQAIARHADKARGRLLDVGCGSRPYESLLTNVDEYVGLDVTTRPGVDVVGDAQSLPFADGSFDTVLCCQVLEHVPDPRKVLSESQRVLRPGGVLLLTTPQVWGLHLEPHDYFRFTRYGLSHLSETAGLEVLQIEPTCGLFATLAQRLADTLTHGLIGHQPGINPLRTLLNVLVSPILLAGYWLDSLFGKRGDTLDNLLIARKPDSIPLHRTEAPYAQAA